MCKEQPVTRMVIHFMEHFPDFYRLIQYAMFIMHDCNAVSGFDAGAVGRPVEDHTL